MCSDVVLATPRLVLRPVGEGDRDAFERAWRDSRARLSPWLPEAWGRCTPAEAFELHLRQQRDTTRDGTGFRRLAVTPAGVPVGTFNVSNIVRGPLRGGFASWSLFTGQSGRGYASEALAGLVRHAFDPAGLDLHRLQANIIPSNIPSLRLARRLGFRREGYARRYLEIAGRWQDHVMTARLADDPASAWEVKNGHAAVARAGEGRAG